MTLAERLLHFASFLVPNNVKDYGKHIVKWEVFSERILENPLIIRHIPEKSSKILDVGSRYSQIPLELASLGHKVWALDIESYAFTHKNLIYVKEDIRHTTFKDDFFDVVTIVSTLEHVGRGETSYGDKEDTDGDIKAMKEISRILKPDGIVLLTIPFGKYRVLPFMRIYDKKRLQRITSCYKIVKEIYMYNDNENWEISTYEKVKNLVGTNHTIGNAFFMLKNNKNNKSVKK